jgi:hypothetical protein
MKCQYCGRDFARLVNKNMHENYCKKNTNEDKQNNNDNNIIINKKEKTCIHDYVLLNDNVPNQHQAISQGYNAYCKKCNELT